MGERAFGLTKLEMVIFVEIRKVWKGYKNFTIIKKMWDIMIFFLVEFSERQKHSDDSLLHAKTPNLSFNFNFTFF